MDPNLWLDRHVRTLLAEHEIRTRAVETAFRRVERHLFPESLYLMRDGSFEEVAYDPLAPSSELLDLIYSGQALVTALQDGAPASSSSESGLVARMLEILGLLPGMRVLEIGTGTGYNAALLAEIVGGAELVTSIDVRADVTAAARRGLQRAGYGAIEVVDGDGYAGHEASAPYDRIIVTVGSPNLSPLWIRQLTEKGRILLPLRQTGANPLLEVSVTDEVPVGRFVGWSGFMAISGHLADLAYYSNAVAPMRETAVSAAPLDGLGKATTKRWAEDEHRAGFWLYLALNDERTKLTAWSPPGFGLVEPDSGDSVRIFPDRVVLDGERLLYDDLCEHHATWQRLGSPRLTDFVVEFLPKGDYRSRSEEGHWLVNGSAYVKRFSLA